MLRKSKEGMQWLEFELLAEFRNVSHGVFLRHGGLSQDRYGSLNFSYTVGDQKHHVDGNFNRLKKALKMEHLAISNQCHKDLIKEVSKKETIEFDLSDSLITKTKNVGLVIRHGDCQACIMYDPINHAVANVHCGWRGSVQNIYHKTIESMKATYGTSKKNLLVCISPSLGPQKAEFVNYKKELPEDFWQYQVRPNTFNFWEISKRQLLSCGVLSHHIEIAKICTFSHPEDYFSHRRDKLTGRHGTAVILR